MSERTRIISNFARMIIAFVIGLILVRQMIGVGPDAFGLYVLLIGGIGLSVIMRELLRVGLVAFLGRAHVSLEETPHAYQSALGTAFVISAILAAIAALLLVGVYVFLPSFGIAPEQLPQARQFVLWRSLYILTSIISYPLIATVLVARKQLVVNLILGTERLLELLALLLAIALVAPNNELGTLITYGAFGAAGLACLTVGLGLWLKRLHAGYRPSFAHAIWADVRGRATSMRAGLLDVAWPFLYLRLDILLLGLFYGPLGTILFGLPVQIVGYLGQISVALVSGLEAVLAQVFFKAKSEGEGTSQDTAAFIRKSGAVQALLTFLFLGFVGLNIQTLISLWLGSRLEALPFGGAQLAIIVAFLFPGMAALALSEPWRAMMTGMGKLDLFVKTAAKIAALNPILLAAYYLVAQPDLPQFALVAAGLYSLLNGVFHIGILPRIAATALGVQRSDLIRPVLMPAAVAIVATVLGYAISGAQSDVASLLFQVPIFAAALGVGLVLIRRA